MEVCIKDMSIKDAARVLQDLAAIMVCSAEHDDIPAEMHASAFEVMGAIAGAIREVAE